MVSVYEDALVYAGLATERGPGPAGLKSLVGQGPGTAEPDVRDRLAGYGRGRPDPVEQAWVMYRLLQPLLPAELRDRLAGREDPGLVLGLLVWGGLPPEQPFTRAQLESAYGPDYVRELDGLAEVGLFTVDATTDSYTRVRPPEMAEAGLGRWEQTLPNPPRRSYVSLLLDAYGIDLAEVADTLRRSAIVDNRYPFDDLMLEIQDGPGRGRRQPVAGFLDRLSVLVGGVAYQATWSDDGRARRAGTSAVVVHRAGSLPRTDLFVAEQQARRFGRQRVSIEPDDTAAETVLALVEALPLLLGGDPDANAVVELNPPQPASLSPRRCAMCGTGWSGLVGRRGGGASGMVDGGSGSRMV